MVATTRAYNDERNLARTGQGYDGVVRITVPGFFGTGVLLGDGLHVLTAAHLANGVLSSRASVEFETSAGRQTLSVSRIDISPDHVESNNDGDLALMTLVEHAPAIADRYSLYRQSDELHQVGTMVGYGEVATGGVGLIPYSETAPRRMGTNRLDATVDQLSRRYPDEIGWYPAQGTQLCADFDNGLSQNDGLGQLLNVADTGVGDDESLLSPGDSGGPLLLQGKVAGIASYTFRFISPSVSPDIDSLGNSSFGEFAAWSRVSNYAYWIDQTLRTEQTGAPSTPAEVQRSVVEGNSGTSFAWFLVTLSRPAQGGEQINFHTEDGTARANVDYLPVVDTLVFYTGEDHVAIPVEVIGNTRVDGNRDFSLVVSDAVGGRFANGQATMSATRTIVDDDGPVLLVGVAQTAMPSSVAAG